MNNYENMTTAALWDRYDALTIDRARFTGYPAILAEMSAEKQEIAEELRSRGENI